MGQGGNGRSRWGTIGGTKAEAGYRGQGPGINIGPGMAGEGYNGVHGVPGEQRATR